MYPAKIEEYESPTTLAAALAALTPREGRETACIAGGMSLMQALKTRLLRVDRLVDLGRIVELRGVRSSPSGVSIGAMTRFADIAKAAVLRGEYQALMDAAEHVGDRQVRNRGTIGGSLCWNYAAACCPPAAMVLDARVELAKADREGKRVDRSVAVDEFLRGPLTTTRAPDEILTAVHLPRRAPRTGSAYAKWGLVADALPVVGIAASVTLDPGDTINAARVALGGLNSGPVRALRAERGLLGASASDSTRVEAAFVAAADDAELHADLWATAEFRHHLIREIGARVLALAVARAKGEQT